MSVINDVRFLDEHEEFDNCRIEKIKLEEGTLIRGKYFTDVTFTDCDWGRCDLSETRFDNCRFINCDLSLCRCANTVLDQVFFSDCRLVGIDWTVMKWPRVVSKKRPKCPVTFLRCSLNYSIFVGLNLNRISFEDCVVKEACFEDAYLGYSSFTETDLSLSSFHNTDLVHADLTTARNYSINACTNVLTKARFSFPEAKSLLYALDIELED